METKADLTLIPLAKYFERKIGTLTAKDETEV